MPFEPPQFAAGVKVPGAHRLIVPTAGGEHSPPIRERRERIYIEVMAFELAQFGRGHEIPQPHRAALAAEQRGSPVRQDGPSGSLRKVSGYIPPPFQDSACRKAGACRSVVAYLLVLSGDMKN
jgi:hypothetical protein